MQLERQPKNRQQHLDELIALEDFRLGHECVAEADLNGIFARVQLETQFKNRQQHLDELIAAHNFRLCGLHVLHRGRSDRQLIVI